MVSSYTRVFTVIFLNRIKIRKYFQVQRQSNSSKVISKKDVINKNFVGQWDNKTLISPKKDRQTKSRYKKYIEYIFVSF